MTRGEPTLEPIKKFVQDIVDNAIFNRTMNTLQSNAGGSVDKSKYVDIQYLRTILYWDIYEYLTGTEWGQTLEERNKDMKKLEPCVECGMPSRYTRIVKMQSLNDKKLKTETKTHYCEEHK